MAVNLNQAISPQVAKYFQAKMAYDPRVLTDIDGGETGEQRALRQMNTLLGAKGGQQIVDLSQADAAFSPLIAKRNKRGIGGIAGIALPILAGVLAGPLGSALAGGLGIGTTAATALAGAGLGGLSGALTGQDPLKSALMGGATAGIGAGLGKAAGSTLAQTTGNVAMQGPTAGTGIAGSLTRGGDALSGLARSISGAGESVSKALALPTNSGSFNPMASGGSSMGNNPLLSAISGYQQYKTASDQEEEMKRAQQQGLAAINPYANSGILANRKLTDALAAGFNPGDLSADEGYQFRLGQGQKQLEQSLAAKGMAQSGAALKAAQEYGQNFANQEFNDAYARWARENQMLSQQAGQGFSAATGQAGIYDTINNSR